MTDISTHTITIQTNGFTDIIDLTPQVSTLLKDTKYIEGQVTIFVGGSTAGLTTIEFEPGLLKDLPDFLEEILPKNRRYEHDNTWHDGNGFSHLRSALIKPTYTIPFSKGKLLLGTWQQLILLDFDNRPRQRQVVVQFLGKK